MMHTESYKRMLQQVHQNRPPQKPWGTTGARNVGDIVVSTLRGRGDVISVLDFGAGQRTLGKYVTKELSRLQWTDYDPGVQGIDVAPTGKFDFVVSSDVLEHVEPEQVGSTVRQMQEYSRRGMLHHIACDPCGLILPDGRNAHLTVRPPEWWKEKFFTDGWELMYYADCLQRKRGGLRRHCIVQLDRLS